MSVHRPTAEVVGAHRWHETDTGSAEVQIALLSNRIAMLTDHMRTHRHDHSARRGLLETVGKRLRMLTYLQGKDVERYRAIVAALGLRR